nr:hypothetical protein [Polaribacter porphyrae]
MALRAVENLDKHPISKLFDLGIIKVCVNTDDLICYFQDTKCNNILFYIKINNKLKL